MRWGTERDPLPRWLGLVYLALAGAGGLVFARWGHLIERLAHCPLRRTTGLPCPTCGGTHAALALVHGRLGQALLLNPLVTLGAAALALWGLYAVVATCVPRWRLGLRLTRGGRLTVRWGLVAAVLLGWAWVIGRTV
jgi:hypothetical protein